MERLFKELEMIDLANLFADDDKPLVDTSGKPLPKNVRVILNSGVEIPCALKYDGTEMSAGVMVRKYLVIAEIDWYKHWVKTLVVGEWPSDVKFAFNTGKEVDPETWRKTEAFKYANQMQLECEKRISV
jgi:hypothetical protein